MGPCELRAGHLSLEPRPAPPSLSQDDEQNRAARLQRDGAKPPLYNYSGPFTWPGGAGSGLEQSASFEIVAGRESEQSIRVGLRKRAPDWDKQISLWVARPNRLADCTRTKLVARSRGACGWSPWLAGSCVTKSGRRVNTTRLGAAKLGPARASH